MTQEEKARAYDEAIERASKLRVQNPFDTVSQMMEHVFPELAESEDERIKKALLYVISSCKEEVFNRVCAASQKECITWLKKQGKPTEINPSEFDLRLNKLLKQFESLPKEELITNLSYYLNVIQNDGTYKIEKQGKESITIDADPVASYYDNVMISDTKNNKKQGEQKHSIDLNKMVDDYANNKERGNEEFGKPVPCMVRAYRQGLNDAIGKVVLKSTWSEADNKWIESLIQTFEDGYFEGFNQLKSYGVIDWLESLKERIGG